MKKLYCVVKKVNLKKGISPDSETILEIKFRKDVKLQKMVRKNIGQVTVIVTNRIYKGYVNTSGFTDKKVTDFAGLFYNNLRGKRLPCAMKIGHQVSGYIEPGEQVKIYAVTGEWCLTNKGWTKKKWLIKDRTIVDEIALDDLQYAILTRAIKDYKNYISKLQQGKYGKDDSYNSLMAKLERLMEWFLSDEYTMLFDSQGSERLDEMNEKMGISRAWLKEHFDRFHGNSTYRRRERMVVER